MINEGASLMQSAPRGFWIILEWQIVGAISLLYGIAVGIYSGRKWGYLSGLWLLGGIITRRWCNGLLCGLICGRAHALNLIEAQFVVNLTIILAGAVAESTAYLHAFLQIINHLVVESLQ